MNSLDYTDPRTGDGVYLVRQPNGDVTIEVRSEELDGNGTLEVRIPAVLWDRFVNRSAMER